MQQQKHFWQTRRWPAHRPPLLALGSAAALLVFLVVAGGTSAHAAPASGAPTLSIVSSQGTTVTLEFDNWALNQPLTLSYSTNFTCSAATPLPQPDFEVSSSQFQANYSLPDNIPQGAYYLCASDPLDGTVASANPFFVTSAGTVQLTPTAPTPTPTRSAASGTPTPGQPTSPGNQGTSASNNGANNTLVALILLCLLVMALLVYLFRFWLLQRRRSSTGGQPPP